MQLDNVLKRLCTSIVPSWCRGEA